MSNPQRQRIHCNTCHHETNHELKGTHRRTYPATPESPVREEIIYHFWLCLGCDAGTLELLWTYEDNTDEQGNQVYESTFYPKRAAGDLVPKKFKALGRKLSSMYQEIIRAYNEGLNILCGGGVRALLEGICADKGIHGQTLEIKISGLKALLPKNIVDNLQGFRFIGNRAMHELEPLSRQDLQLAIEIVEDLLNFIYELDYKATKLGKTTREAKPQPSVVQSSS